MKKILLLYGMFAALLSGCTEQQDLTESLTEQKQIIEEKNPCAIPIETALEYLSDFLEDSDLGKSRSANDIGGVYPVKYNHVASRAEQDSLNCDNLLYVANFANDKGYAVLAGDTRISDKVIVLADSGSLSRQTVNIALSEMYRRPVFKNYPTTGPGFFTTPETGDEVFMNLNTVSLYDAEKGGYLIGDFYLDEEEILDEGGLNIDSESKLIRTAELLPTKLTVDYAKRQIANNGRLNLSIPNNRDGMGNGGSGGSGDGQSDIETNSTEVIEGAWSIVRQVPPILWHINEWTQEDPFNDLYPYVRHFPLFWKKRRAYAGCFPLAIAKVLTLLQYPRNYTHRGYTIDWYSLNYGINDWKLSAAHLLKKISSDCNSLYFYTGTFTWPFNARSYMNSIGFNASIKDYEFELVTSMIDNHKPVIIYGIPGWQLTSCHCWNIDGYKIKTRTKTINTYKNNELVKTEQKQETYKMVHCDYNQGGTNNGYYVSGVFNTEDSRVEMDYGKGSYSLNYNWLLQVLLY